MLTLDQGTVGKIYQVVGFTTDDDNSAKNTQENHLKNLGLAIGSSIYLIEQQKSGGILVIKNGKVALDNQTLKKIIITEDITLPKISLADLPVGETGKIATILGSGALKRRLLDMGLTKGVTVFLRKKAPLGDPLQIRIRGYELSLRKQEAEMIMLFKEDK